MSNTTWIRARNEEQKSVRERAILSSAMELFLRVPYEDVTLLKIANNVGITRTTIYLYFKTREEIFLALYVRELQTWVEEIVRAFCGALSLGGFVDVWTDVLYRREGLLHLTPLFATSIERNTADDVLIRAKVEINNQMRKVVPVLIKVVPGMTESRCYSFFVTHQAVVAGLWPMTQYTEQTLKKIRELALNTGIIEFRSFYKESILHYLTGLIRTYE